MGNSKAGKHLFSASDLRFTTVDQCTPEDLTKVIDHVGTLNSQRDDEVPESYSGWILRHGRYREGPEYLQPHQIYVAFDKSGKVVDIAGIVPDDRDVASQEGLRKEDPTYLGFFGGHNVHPALRGEHIGRLMIKHRIRCVQDYVDATGKEATVYTFLVSKISCMLLEQEGGFEYVGERFIRHSGKTESLFLRRFKPNPIR